MSSFTFQLKAFRHFLFVCPAVFILAVTLSSPGHTESILPRDVPVYLNAEQIKHDQNLDITIASGKVEITQGNRILFADTLTYNKSTNSVAAKGNVTLLEPEGHVLFADYVELTNDMRDGVIEQLRVQMADDTLLAANGARKEGPITHMSKAVFSPCKVCEENPERPPLWQIKANQVIHDNETHNIEYKDAFLEMFGMPVFYLPYFSHPDPSVKHRSGFLSPSFGGGNLGFTSRIPYYLAINPQIDATLTPIYTADQGPVFAGEFRERLKDGEFRISGSITKADRTDNDGVVEKDLIRGHLEADGRFDINRTWRWGFDALRTTDDTYLRLYEFNGEQVLTSRLYAEGFRGRSYASFDSYLFQDLRPDIDTEQTTQALPILNYNFVGNPSRWGDYWTLDTNLLNLVREEGIDSRRLSVKGGWHRNFSNIHGHVFNLASTLRGDIYDVKQTDGSNLDKNPGRIFPQLSANWRYPLQRKTGTTHQLIEPIASVVFAPNGGNPDDIPNEDSLAFEFDDSDLFIPNRFVGLDRIEGGKRVDYGIRLGTYGSKGGSTKALIGQSYRLRDDSLFEEKTGLQGHFSDFVGNVQIRPGSYFDAIYRFRLDKEKLSPTLSDVTFSAGSPILRVNTNYLDIQSGVSAGNFEARKEVSFGVSSQFHKDWKISANATRDLISDGSMVWMGSALTYEDECFSVISNYSRSYTRDRDLEPTDAIFIQLVFKNLGTVQSQKTFQKFSSDSENPN
jgi:LPS-assembly protein